VIYSAYRPMWLIAMFDLPVTSKLARKRATEFRSCLLDAGFIMLQYSVYARFCESAESADFKRLHLRANLPPNGAVRLLAVTDRQFAKMEHYRERKRADVDQPPEQSLLF
jgi:CRISPR-associated protein Cas2